MKPMEYISPSIEIDKLDGTNFLEQSDGLGENELPIKPPRK